MDNFIVGNSQVGCWVAGQNKPRSIVFMHGSTVTSRSWQPQMEALQSEYQVMACDLPGHGLRADEPFSVESALVQLNDSLDRLTKERVLLVGVSLGGHLATLFASRYPDKIAGLVISGASMNFTGLVGIWMRLAGKLMLQMSEGRLKRSAAKSIRRKWPADTAQDQIEAGLYPHAAAQSFLELPRYDFRQQLSRVQAPVLILNGELDRPNRKGESQFATVALNSRIEIIHDAGHACNLEQPEAYTASLRRFAEELNWIRAGIILDNGGLDSKI